MTARFAAQDQKISELSERITSVRAELIEKIVQSKWESVRWTLAIVLSVASLQTALTAAMLHWMR